MSQCTATTLKGSQCSFNAKVQGLCTKHAQMQGVVGPAEKTVAQRYDTVSYCAGRAQDDCPAPRCTWRTTKGQKPHCHSVKRTQSKYA